jgi:PTH1 family peptidyl-tRNA hydrolase
MKLIVGLGNPGEKYSATRHNLGFMTIEHFLQDATQAKKTEWSKQKKFQAEIAAFDWQTKHKDVEAIILAKPTTFMNDSGNAVASIASFYKISPEDIWIVHDELDVPLGNMKIRLGGTGAGHRGIESVITSLGAHAFWRFRLGIGPDKHHDDESKHKISDVETFVISPFERSEAGKARELIKKGAKALETALEEGMSVAMNKFNTK